MAQRIEADVIQKIATPAEWATLLDTKIPYKGQIMLVSDGTGKVTNIKVGDGTNNFASLTYMFDTIQANVNYVQVTSTALPTPTITSGFSVVGEGTYTRSGQPNVIVPAESLGILGWNGTAWSLSQSVVLPQTDLSNVVKLDTAQNINGKKKFNPAVATQAAGVNLLLWSNTLSNAYWISRNNVSAPVLQGDGSWLLTMTNANNFFRAVANVQPETQYTFSFWAKRGTATELKWSIYNQTGLTDITPATSYYALTNSSEFVRVSLTFTTPVGCVQVGVYPIRTTGGTGTVYFRDFQLNMGTIALPYVETEGSSGSSTAMGTEIIPTLTASNDKDRLVGLSVSPNFQDSGKTDVEKIGADIKGPVESLDYNKVSYNGVSYEMTLKDTIAGNTSQPFYKSSKGYYVFIPKTADTAVRYYLIPKGNPTGVKSKLELFATDYNADTVNYNALNILVFEDTIHFGCNKNGTKSDLKQIIGGKYFGSSLTTSSARVEFNLDDTVDMYGKVWNVKRKLNLATLSALPSDAVAGDIIFHNGKHKGYNGVTWNDFY